MLYDDFIYVWKLIGLGEIAALILTLSRYSLSKQRKRKFERFSGFDNLEHMYEHILRGILDRVIELAIYGFFCFACIQYIPHLINPDFELKTVMIEEAGEYEEIPGETIVRYLQIRGECEQEDIAVRAVIAPKLCKGDVITFYDYNIGGERKLVLTLNGEDISSEYASWELYDENKEYIKNKNFLGRYILVRLLIHVLLFAGSLKGYKKRKQQKNRFILDWKEEYYSYIVWFWSLIIYIGLLLVVMFNTVNNKIMGVLLCVFWYIAQIALGHAIESRLSFVTYNQNEWRVQYVLPMSGYYNGAYLAENLEAIDKFKTRYVLHFPTGLITIRLQDKSQEMIIEEMKQRGIEYYE